MTEKVEHTALRCQTAREYLESGGAAETLAFTQAVQDAGYHKCQIDIDMALVLLADFIAYPALLAERDRLREALKPFAEFASGQECTWSNLSLRGATVAMTDATAPTIDDYRRARAALKDTNQ